MNKLRKISLYLNTIKHLKPSQIFYRIWRKLGGKTGLKFGYAPHPDLKLADINHIPVLPELDFDEAFLARYDVDVILKDRVCLLHHEETVDWDNSWHKELSTPLWRFNLHYCEYLLPLAKAFIESNDVRYLDKGKQIISSWIECCPESKKGPAWDPYTISMRIVNWLAFYGELAAVLRADTEFVTRMNESLAQQFVVLSESLEVDLLANHYLEDLKALVILSCYFHDEETLNLTLPRFYAQVEEQVLPDGMHFELSPMYHKIILEDFLRLAITLQKYGEVDVATRLRLQDMANCLFSLERGTNRTPLFNDSGDNVAKGRDALLYSCKLRFDIEPIFKSVFPDAGYCVLERKTNAGCVKIIFDAGNPGPEYAMGHAHCDALSFECFIDGEPWIVNSGTFAYQDEKRLEFKRTNAHNTVVVDGEEQHECWAPFRVARFGSSSLVSYSDSHVEGVAKSYQGKEVRRVISLTNQAVKIADTSENSTELNTFIHFCGKSGQEDCSASYSPEFGLLLPLRTHCIKDQSLVACHIDFKGKVIVDE